MEILKNCGNSKKLREFMEIDAKTHKMSQGNLTRQIIMQKFPSLSIVLGAVYIVRTQVFGLF